MDGTARLGGWSDIAAIRRRLTQEQQEARIEEALLDALCGEHGRVVGCGRLVQVYRAGAGLLALTREDMVPVVVAASLRS